MILYFWAAKAAQKYKEGLFTNAPPRND